MKGIKFALLIVGSLVGFSIIKAVIQVAFTFWFDEAWGIFASGVFQIVVVVAVIAIVYNMLSDLLADNPKEEE